MRKYIAELLGTFALTLAVSVSILGASPLPTPAVAAFTLALFVYTIGHISGTHLNPAITIGLWSVKKIGMKDGAAYVISQFIGAGLAMFIVKSFLRAPQPLVVNILPVGFAEFMGAFFFAFGVAAVVYGKVSSYLSGVVVGWSLLLGILLASSFSNGILNPAVAFGINSFSLMYVLGPILGAILGTWAFKLISKE